MRQVMWHLSDRSYRTFWYKKMLRDTLVMNLFHFVNGLHMQLTGFFYVQFVCLVSGFKGDKWRNAPMHGQLVVNYLINRCTNKSE